MKIIKLDNSISNKIAAGEVIERPASVVKELVENSIDAGSTQITVEIKEAGKDLIRVSDNGSGIDRKYISLAFERHATSKIETIDDIYSISTLGFRGEALSSIAAASRIEIISRCKDDEVAYKCNIENSIVSKLMPIGSNVGTSISVMNLFYNTPARFNFMKSNRAENLYIVELVDRLAIGNPNISFTLIVDKKEIYRTDGRGILLNTLLKIYGNEFIDNLIEYKTKNNLISLNGFVSIPSMNRGNRKFQFLYVNGRYISHSIIHTTINDIFAKYLPKSRFCVFIINIKVPYNSVDVNIHPSKKEVLFKNYEYIEELISSSIVSTLESHNLTPVVDFNTSIGDSSVESFNSNNYFEENAQKILIENSIDFIDNIGVKDLKEYKSISNKKEKNSLNYIENYTRESSKPIIEETMDYENLNLNSGLKSFVAQELGEFLSEYKEKEQEEIQLNIERTFEESNYSNLKVLSQLFSTYILAQNDNRMYVIDQHGLHERILYEEFYIKFREDKLETQVLLDRIEYKLPSLVDKSESSAIVSNLKKIGLQASIENEHLYISTVPIFFKRELNYTEVISLIDISLDKSIDIDIAIDEQIKKIACTRAVKSSTELSIVEMQNMVDKIQKLNIQNSSAHGKTIMFYVKREELPSFFK